MSELLRLTRDALFAHRGGRLSVEELAGWARDQTSSWLSDMSRRYAFADDVVLEALHLLGGSDDAPDPGEEVAAAAALLQGDVPFRASRLLLLDAEWIARSPCATAAQALAEAGARLDSGEDWRKVISRAGALLARETEALAGDDYVQLVAIDAAAVCDDLRLAVDGSIELLGPGRPRIDAGLLAERIAAAGQVLAGERPLRATVVAARPDEVRVVLGY